MEEAEEYAVKAIALFRQQAGDSDVHYAAAVCTLAELYFAKNSYEEAGKLYAEAMRLIARDYGTDNGNYRTLEKNYLLCQKKMSNVEDVQ